MSPALLALAATLFLDSGRAASPARAAMRISGVDQEGRDDLIKLLELKRGEVWDAQRSAVSREVTLSFLQNRGWLEAQVATGIEAQALVVNVTTGPLYRFGQTRFQGLTKVSEAALRGDVPWKEGDPYRRPLVLSAQSRLFARGLFEDVEISVSTTVAKSADVDIRLRERPHKWVKTGVGWGSEERERLSLALTHNNLFHRAYSAEASVLYSHIWVEYRGEFINKHFWGSNAEQRTSVSWRRENRQGYDLERTRGQMSWTSVLPHHLRLTTQYRAQSVALYNLDPQIAAAVEDGRPLASGAAMALDYDTTNDFFFPSRGVRTGILAERQGGFLLGDVDLNRASAHAAVYQPIWRGLVAAIAVSGGVVRKFGETPAVPIYERYFMGGANSVRGYRERDVGVKDALGNPLGGNVFARGGFEARFPIYKRLGGALFVDGGQVDARESQVAPSKWKWGAGPGLRVRTPVGPLRLDFGYKLNPDQGAPTLWTVHLSLGEAF